MNYYEDNRRRKKSRNQSKSKRRITKYRDMHVSATPDSSFIRPSSLNDPIHGLLQDKAQNNKAILKSKIKISRRSQQLTTCPREILNSSVQEIYLQDNKIDSFIIDTPLDSLKYLNLSGNLLTGLPYCKGEGRVPKLISLDVSFNSFGKIDPIHLKSIKNLISLDLSNTELKVLPPEIGSFSFLSVLWLRNNHLVELPREIIQLTELKDFDVHGNELRIPLQDIVEQEGFNAVKAYFKSASEKEIHHCKLILLGAVGCGKRSLREHLNALDSSIAIHPENKDVSIQLEFSVIDFSNLSVHEIFFTSYSFYLICMNMMYTSLEDIDNNIQYWIDLIQSKVTGATIVIVGTHIDQLLSKDILINIDPTEFLSNIEIQNIELKIFQRLKYNEELRINDLRMRINDPNRIARLLGTRPLVHPRIVPLCLASVAALSSLLQTPSPTSTRSISPMPIFRRVSMGTDALSRVPSRAHSETDMIKLNHSHDTTANATASCHANISSLQKRLVNVGALRTVIEELVGAGPRVVPPVECHQYRAQLDEYYLLNKDKPYCTLKQFQEYLNNETTIRPTSATLVIVVEYWTALGLIMKFDLNSSNALTTSPSLVYLVLDPCWLSDCLSGITVLEQSNRNGSMKTKASPPSFSSPIDANAVSDIDLQCLRNNLNGFLKWFQIKSTLLRHSSKLRSYHDADERETFMLLRHILQAMNIIIPAEVVCPRPGPNLHPDRSFTDESSYEDEKDWDKDDNLDSQKNDKNDDQIFLIPCLMLDGEASVYQNQNTFPLPGCVQLEKRIYLPKFFVPPDILPRILAKIYAKINDFTLYTFDSLHSSTTNNKHEKKEKEFIGYCWKTAFSQEINHMTISVYLITPTKTSTSSSSQADLPLVSSVSSLTSMLNYASIHSNDTDDGMSGLPVDNHPYIRVICSGHILMVHSIVRLMSEYWETIESVLQTFPGLDYVKHSLCPLCLMRQRPPHDCGVFTDGLSDCDFNYSDDELDAACAASFNNEANAPASLMIRRSSSSNQSTKTMLSEYLDDYVSLYSDDSDDNCMRNDSYRHKHTSRICPKHGCHIKSDFFLYFSNKVVKQLFPNNAMFLDEMKTYILSEIRNSRGAGPDSDNIQDYSNLQIVTVIVYKYDNVRVSHEKGAIHEVYDDTQELIYVSGLMIDCNGQGPPQGPPQGPGSRARRLLLTSLGAGISSSSVFVVKCLGEPLVAKLIPSSSSSLNGLMNVLEIMTSSSLSIHKTSLQVITPPLSIEAEWVPTRLLQSLISFRPVDIETSVQMLFITKHGHFHKVYGRIIRKVIPEEHDIGLGVLYVVSACSDVIVGATVFRNDDKHTLIGMILNTPYKKGLQRVYYIGTPGPTH